MNNNTNTCYNRISSPINKKSDIKSIFKGYEIIEHTNAEMRYRHLEDNYVVLEVVNPYRNENLFIELAEEFTSFFSRWYSTYFTNEYDYSELKKTALAIINGEYAALSLLIDDEWLGSTLLKDEISQYTNPHDLIDKMHLPKDQLQRIRDNGVIVFADYWKPTDCFEFDIPKESEQTVYSFPRIYGCRFIIKDGKQYGSGLQKQYDNETAMISYVYVDDDIDDTYNAAELEIALIRLLEADAKKAGLKRIFSNIEDSEFDLYSSLGYTETAKIDNKRVWRLCGAIVIFDKTMIKEL